MPYRECEILSKWLGYNKNHPDEAGPVPNKVEPPQADPRPEELNLYPHGTEPHDFNEPD